jgi:hypothetical protein
MPNDNPSCLKLDLDTNKQKRGDFFINGVTGFSVALKQQSKGINFTISFTATASSSKAEDVQKGNDPIKLTGFELDKTEYEQLAKKEIIFFEIKTDDPKTSAHYILDVKNLPKLEIAQDGTLTISLLLLNYWLGGEEKFYKDGSLPGEASSNSKKNPGIPISF